MEQKKYLSRREFLRMVGITTAGAALAACAKTTTEPTKGVEVSEKPTDTVAAPEVVELLFTFWGSPTEKDAVIKTADKFNAENPNIKVNPQHIPNDVYTEKVISMIAGGTSPDVFYASESFSESLAVEGKLLDCKPYFEADPQMKTYLKQMRFYYGGKYIGVGIAGEAELLFYDKDQFDKAGLEYPPADPAKAWEWDKFVEVAKKLTKDTNGNDASSPQFDPDNIATFGFTFPTWWLGYTIFVYSNGGQLASDDGMDLLLNKPEAVEAFQKLQDLIYVHHVSPNPAQLQQMYNLATHKWMETQRVAMDMNGHWMFIDYATTKINLGVAVLPYMKKVFDMLSVAPMVISQGSKYPEAAVQWYKFMHDPEKCDLFKEGLWMPLLAEYYEDPKKIDAWLKGKPGVYPPEAKQVLVDFIYHNTPVVSPFQLLQNSAQILQEAVDPAASAIFANEKTPQVALDEAVSKAKPLMKGIWPPLD